MGLYLPQSKPNPPRCHPHDSNHHQHLHMFESMQTLIISFSKHLYVMLSTISSFIRSWSYTVGNLNLLLQCFFSFTYCPCFFLETKRETKIVNWLNQFPHNSNGQSLISLLYLISWLENSTSWLLTLLSQLLLT